MKHKIQIGTVKESETIPFGDLKVGDYFTLCPVDNTQTLCAKTEDHSIMGDYIDYFEYKNTPNYLYSSLSNNTMVVPLQKVVVYKKRKLCPKY